MEHSVKAYLERMPLEELEELEEFLHRCMERKQEEQYRYLLPLIYEILLQRQGERG